MRFRQRRNADSTAKSAPICGKRRASRRETGPVRSKALIGTFEKRLDTMLDRRSGYEYEDLLACGRGEMFGPGNAQLPLPPMLMFDRISEISRDRRRIRQGPGPRRTRREAGPLVLRLPFQERSGDAGLPRPRRDVADGRLLSRLDRRRGARPGAGPRRIEVLRPGAAECPQGCVQHRHQARDAFKAGARHRRRLAFHGWRDYLSRQGFEGRAVQAGHARRVEQRDQRNRISSQTNGNGRARRS